MNSYTTLLILVSFLMIGCSKYESGPCEAYNSGEIGTRHIQTCYTSDSSSLWLGTDSNSTFSFYNRQGIRLNFEQEEVQTTLNNLRVGEDYVGSRCSSFDYIGIYASIEQKIHTFRCTNYSFFYQYIREATYPQDTSFVHANSDHLSINLNNTVFNLPLNNESVSNWKKSDSITLRGTVYHNVYHVFSDSSNWVPNKIEPAGIYYTTREGLVAFYYTNGELWAK